VRRSLGDCGGRFRTKKPVDTLKRKERIFMKTPAWKKDWSAADRAKYLDTLANTDFDILIVGGGITGAGLLRASAARGLSVALIDKEDFAFGTSSKSTRLAHGGFRYIVQGDFGLVWESCHERDWLRWAFPNLVVPVAIIGATRTKKYTRLSRPVLGLYDLLSAYKNYKNHRALSRDEMRRTEPRINLSGIDAGFLVHECLLNDARLTVEIVKEGCLFGGTAVNYVAATKIVTTGGRAAGCEALDRETGRTFKISAKNVVVTAGPWCDDLLPKERRPVIRPTKGVHLILRREDIGNEGGLHIANPADNRGVFVLVHGDFTYVGTTDTDYTGDLNHCYTDWNDFDYFKGFINYCFPDAHFSPESLVGSYAGTRPLVRMPGVSETATSRKDLVDEISPGFFILTGGKLTIFRAMAEKAIAFMAKRGAISVDKKSEAVSRAPFVVGIGPIEWEKAAPRRVVDKKTAAHLYKNYGRGGIDIIEGIKRNGSLGEAVVKGQPNVWGELDHCLQHEMITRTKDFLLRRTNLSLHQRDGHEALGKAVAQRMGKFLGWDKKRIDAEVADYVDLAHKNRFFLRKR
jgi:glycerol-3-phosphate dehydrogenase